MSFTWTAHRFAGGALALDVANSVILRNEPKKSVDRFAVLGQIDGFCEAAVLLSGERELFPVLLPPSSLNQRVLIDLREATDLYFRKLAEDELDDDKALADLLLASANAVRNAPNKQCLENSTARSVLALLSGANRKRIRVCENCGWLFIDRSKNRSRVWCDMSVCGNRKKAAKYYRRKKEASS